MPGIRFIVGDRNPVCKGIAEQKNGRYVARRGLSFGVGNTPAVAVRADVKHAAMICFQNMVQSGLPLPSRNFVADYDGWSIQHDDKNARGCLAQQQGCDDGTKNQESVYDNAFGQSK